LRQGRKRGGTFRRQSHGGYRFLDISPLLVNPVAVTLHRLPLDYLLEQYTD
jgi:hypothetical protein